MNRRSYSYLVRALNDFASLTARCGLKEAPDPVSARVPIPRDAVSRESRRLRRSVTRNEITSDQVYHFGKKYR
jgi:hypothetical protein